MLLVILLHVTLSVASVPLHGSLPGVTYYFQEWINPETGCHSSDNRGKVKGYRYYFLHSGKNLRAKT